jgi:hypothetical protein
MGGVRWDRVRAALGAIVPTTAPRDRMELRFFTQVVSRPQLVFEGADGEGRSRSRNRSEAVKGLLQARIPGGSTDILYSLDGLAAAREGRSRDPEERGLIVLITDGITNSVWGLRSKVRARIAAAGDRLVVVKVGTDELGGRFLDGLTLEGESVLEAGELEGLEDLLHQELQDVRLVEGGRVVAAAPGAAAAGWVAPLRAGVLEAAALDRPWVLERALRSRPVEDAVALLEVDLPLGAGERGTLVAVAERGEGTVAGVALPWLGLGDGAWSPTLSRRPAWLAPLLRTMALRAEAAREEEPRPRAWLSAGGELVVRGLPPGLPASLEARLTAAPSVDVFGGLGERAVVATVDLRAPAVDPAPDRVRVGPRPDALDRQPRGTELLLELPAPATALVVRADGPREAFPPAATALTRALGAAGPPGGAAVPDGAEDTQWPHPLTPLLLWGAAISLFLGALGGLRGLLGEARGAGSEAPGGQGSR